MIAYFFISNSMLCIYFRFYKIIFRYLQIFPERLVPRDGKSLEQAASEADIMQCFTRHAG
ncbi:MAG: hypothetical protein C0631_07680 [Sedimenticola sp.]|nr:MAG: hypothetical protein C0631_07680 [Sedimenticola sp.]